MNLNNKNTPFFQTYPQIPLFPIYGYDNSEEAERDFDYMKQLYPRSSLKIQELIEEACDKLEYEGSIMFDEYPDRLQLALMANKIYNQIAPSALSISPQPATQAMAPDYDYQAEYGEETSESTVESVVESDFSATAFSSPGGFPGGPGGRPGRPAPPPPPPPGGRPGRPVPPPPPGGHPGRPVPPPPPGGHPGRPTPPPPWRPASPPNSDNPNWLRNLIDVMLCNEMCQRRRRYRSRKRWM